MIEQLNSCKSVIINLFYVFLTILDYLLILLWITFAAAVMPLNDQ